MDDSGWVVSGIDADRRDGESSGSGKPPGDSLAAVAVMMTSNEVGGDDGGDFWERFSDALASRWR